MEARGELEELERKRESKLPKGSSKGFHCSTSKRKKVRLEDK